MINVFNMERFATKDGPGIRTCIFLQGCMLRCPWCANPESHELKGNGDWYSVEALMQEIRRDKDYYDASGGGVTFSGGEPLLQAKQLTELAKQCKMEGISTAIETCGNVPLESFKEIDAYIDHYLYDLKHLDEVELKQICKGNLPLILSNLEYLDKNKTIVRIAAIPNFNEPYIDDLLEYLRTIKVKEVHLLAYHTLAMHKYEKQGIPYQWSNTPMNKEVLKPFQSKYEGKLIVQIV